MSEREPLQSISTNTLPTTPLTSSSHAGPSKPLTTTTTTPSSATRPIKLAPIFTRTYSRTPPITTPSQPRSGPSTNTTTNANATSSSPNEDEHRHTKRVRRGSLRDDLMDVDDCEWVRHNRTNSIHDYYVVTPLRSDAHTIEGKDLVATTRRKRDEPIPSETGWRRRRGRMGVCRGANMITMSSQRLISPHTPYLERLVTRLAHNPLCPPSVLMIPSMHPWQQSPREYAPPLAVTFSHSAKSHSAQSARETGSRRMVAIAAEEGGVRIVDVDEESGDHRDAKGWFWRAHGNAVLDVKWSHDDTKILTAAGDATARLHSLNDSTPNLIATMMGHTASLKAATFFDPTRSSIDPSISSSVIATTGRDGNIFIYDVRTRGNVSSSNGNTRRSGRNRYSEGVPGFAPQDGEAIMPVLEIRHAHDSLKKKTPRSITSLIALRSLPGVLASGAGHEGVVKLWDPRFTRSHPSALSSLPDPTIYTPSKRTRGIHAMAEQPTTGDLHILTGDSKVHVLRPSASLNTSEDESPAAIASDAIQPVRYTHPEMRSSFWMGLSFSPCGRYLASGSAKGGLMTWDTQHNFSAGKGLMREVSATRLGLGESWEGVGGREREVNAVDWGYDMIAACADDCGTRIWREDKQVAERLRADPAGLDQEWAGVIRQ